MPKTQISRTPHPRRRALNDSVFAHRHLHPVSIDFSETDRYPWLMLIPWELITPTPAFVKDYHQEDRYILASRFSRTFDWRFRLGLLCLYFDHEWAGLHPDTPHDDRSRYMSNAGHIHRLKNFLPTLTDPVSRHLLFESTYEPAWEALIRSVQSGSRPTPADRFEWLLAEMLGRVGMDSFSPPATVGDFCWEVECLVSEGVSVELEAWLRRSRLITRLQAAIDSGVFQ